MLKALKHKLAIVKRSPKPARFVISRILWRTGACRLITIRRDGYRVRFFPSAVSANMWLDPQDLRGDEEFLAKSLRPNDTVVDVGANIGTVAIFAALRVGPNGRVYALEAHPATARYLANNVELNGLSAVVRVINCAASDTGGDLHLSNIKSDDQNCVLTGAKWGVPVPGTTLDATIVEECVDLLKVDVEGYELMVLRGACDMLKRTRAIYFEASDEHFARYGYRFCDLWDFLVKQGFDVVDWRTREPVLRSHEISECINLLAIKSE